MNATKWRRLPLAKAIECYLTLRHQLGFALEREGGHLVALGRYARAHPHRGFLTAELLVDWARSSPAASARQQARRFEIGRRFAQFWAPVNPATEVPPAGWLGPCAAQRTAHLYSPQQIQALLGAARQLPGPPWRALTYYTLLGLLACTGMRISEALQLQRQDLNWAQRQLTLQRTKAGKSRVLVLHPTTWAVLRHYDRQRPKTAPAGPFFSHASGAALSHDAVWDVFTRLQHQLGWPAPKRRLHDLRHTFVVNHLIACYRQGRKVDASLLALSAYLGHSAPQHTYWYLSAVPELLALVQARW